MATRTSFFGEGKGKERSRRCCCRRRCCPDLLLLLLLCRCRCSPGERRQRPLPRLPLHRGVVGQRHMRLFSFRFIMFSTLRQVSTRLQNTTV